MSNDNFDRDLIKNSPKEVRDDLNADPITGEPGAHPIGSAAGPVGTAVGGVVGAVVGGLAGHGVGEVVNPTEEEAYWRENSLNTPYYTEARTSYSDLDYDRDYHTAYQVGYENRAHYDANTRFEDAESDLRIKWEQVKGESRLNWEQAKYAIRDAWNRVSR